MTVNLRRELIDEAKNAYWLARGDYVTFAAWVDEALRRQIDTMKTAHGVDEIPPRPGALPPGRPLS
ncbi:MULTISPECIES: hypothetical protein [unclassified Pseudonocardia]|uniref:hypothetical protein n=1 Tax=unclassified Pseudonocardia TaxID=2619320 RepID=UPI0011153899|nr:MULTISPECIES: hypothetical protein [unclassified Pseudonocardia]